MNNEQAKIKKSSVHKIKRIESAGKKKRTVNVINNSLNHKNKKQNDTDSKMLNEVAFKSSQTKQNKNLFETISSLMILFSMFYQYSVFQDLA